jgi:hypothetical protein
MWEGENGNPACGACRAPTYVIDMAIPTFTDPEHAPDCPIPSMPKIVAALETAERLVSEDDAMDCGHISSSYVEELRRALHGDPA